MLLSLGQVSKAELPKNLLKDEAVQVIYQRPAQFARHDTAHRRLVASTPGQCKLFAVHRWS
jgi:hypothetical protein